eukprot:gene11651-34360_t
MRRSLGGPPALLPATDVSSVVTGCALPVLTTTAKSTRDAKPEIGRTNRTEQVSGLLEPVPLKPASDVLAGALARAASQTTIHPLDTLKVRIQARTATGIERASATSKSFDLVRWGNNVKSMYRGVVGAASGAGIAIGAYFAFYGVACNMLTTKTDLGPSAVAFTAGGIAAAGSSLVKVPLAVCIRSVQAGVYHNVFHAARTIVSATGPRGLFTGYLPTLMEDVPDMAIKFAAYESFRQLRSHLNPHRSATAQEDFAMGAAAGAMAAAATTPLDVIKTNMMCTAASRPTMASASAMVYAEGGAMSFFRGIGARAASNGINSAVFFCFFEAIRTHLAERERANPQMQIRIRVSGEIDYCRAAKNSTSTHQSRDKREFRAMLAGARWLLAGWVLAGAMH